MDKCPFCFTTGRYHRKDCPNNTEVTIIKTEAEYNNIKTKVADLEKEIGDNWYIKEGENLIPNKQYEIQINQHQKLASSMLDYEVNNNLLPL